MTRMLLPDELALRWSEVKPFIDRALAHGVGESTAHDLFMECMEKRSVCWEVPGKAFAIVRFIRMHGHDQLQIVTTAGEGWKDYGPQSLAILEDFAKQEGCKYVSIWGRKGWERVLPEGYQHTYSVFHKELL